MSSSTQYHHLADPARGLSLAHGQIRIGSSSHVLIMSDSSAQPTEYLLQQARLDASMLLGELEEHFENEEAED